MRHIWQNFQNIHKGDILKNQLWKCARSNTAAVWDANMEELKAIDIEAYNWLEQLPPILGSEDFREVKPSVIFSLTTIVRFSISKCLTDTCFT